MQGYPFRKSSKIIQKNDFMFVFFWRLDPLKPAFRTLFLVGRGFRKMLVFLFYLCGFAYKHIVNHSSLTWFLRDLLRPLALDISVSGLDGETWPDDPMLDLCVDDYSFTLEVGRLYVLTFIYRVNGKKSRCWSTKFIFSAIKTFMNKLYVIFWKVFGWDWFLIFVLACVTTLIWVFCQLLSFGRVV